MALCCRVCGTAWEGETIPLRAVCQGCGSFLHSCRHCRFHEEGGRRCSEPSSDPPSDPEGGNWCDWFRPSPGPGPGGPLRPDPKVQAEAAWRKLTARKG